MATVIDNRNFLTMRTRIGKEIKRDNLDDTIAEAIGDAIYFYQQKKFFFQETSDSSVVTVQGTNIYSPPQDLVTIDELELKLSSIGEIRPLTKRSFDWIVNQDLTVPSIQGQPTDYAYYANQVRVWPTPNAAGYVFVFWYKGQIPPPVADQDAGYWMTTAELMIRCYAKYLIYGGVLRNLQQADFELKCSERQYDSLSGTNASLQFSARTKPTKF